VKRSPEQVGTCTDCHSVIRKLVHECGPCILTTASRWGTRGSPEQAGYCHSM